MDGHSNLGKFNKIGASSIFTWVQTDTASLALLAQSSNLEMMPNTLPAVMCDAEDPCSKKHCVRARDILCTVST